MKRILTILLLGLVNVAMGAVTIKTANVEANGWVLNVTVGSEGTNGGFTMGFGTNNSGAGNVAVTLSSSGYDTTGAATTQTRTLYATKVLRLAYGVGGQAQNNFVSDVQASGSDCVIRLALSDFVYSSDTSITLTTPANWYSNNVPATNALTVANNSTLTYAMAKPIANWSWPGFQRWTGTTALRVTAAHRHGMNGSPVACVIFTVSDTHSHTMNVTNSTPTIDATMGDAVPVVEFVSNIDPTSLTDGDLLSCNFKVYPWIGDSGAVLDSSSAGFPFLSPFPHQQTNYLDKAATAMWYAVVDPTNGNNGTGYITNTFNSSGPPKPYLDIMTAAAALINASHEATIYLTNGTFAVSTDSGVTKVTKSWAVVTPFPGIAAANVTINNAADAFHRFGPNCMIKYAGLTIAGSHEIWFFNGGQMWWDQCVVNNTATAAFDDNSTAAPWYVTRSTITQLSQGLTRFGTSGIELHLARGNTDNGACKPWNPHHVIGNLYQSSGTGQLFTSDPTVQNYLPDFGIIACNQLMKLNGNGTFASLYGGSQNLSNGCAIVNNVFESIAASSPGTLLFVHGDSSTGGATNAILWCNTVLGERSNIAYNDTGSAAAYTVLWSVKNNFFADYNIKSDTFTTANGARIGNWANVWGVGYSGNFNSEETGLLGAGSFLCEWFGLNSYAPSLTANTQPPACTANATSYPQFTSDLSWAGGSATAGAGNYRLLSVAPACANGWQSEWFWPFDLDKVYRGGFDPPGAYASASPRKGGAFFRQ